MLNINYVAGIFDGEGSIGLHKRRIKESSRGYLYYPKIRLGMSNDGYQIVKELKNQFGGLVSITKKKKENHKDLLTWTITSRKEILTFLNETKDCLVVKKPQAMLVLDFFNNGTHNQDHWKSNKMPDEEYLRREKLCEKVKFLNKRGK